MERLLEFCSRLQSHREVLFVDLREVRIDLGQFAQHPVVRLRINRLPQGGEAARDQYLGRLAMRGEDMGTLACRQSSFYCQIIPNEFLTGFIF